MKTKTTTLEFFRLRVRPWGLITASGIVVAVASVVGSLGAYSWFFDLFSHFRVQYFLVLCAVAILLLIPRKRLLATSFGALAVANLCVILPLYVGRTPEHQSGLHPVRAMLANVNTKTGNATDVSAAIRRFNPDIVILEEVNTKWLADLKPVLDTYTHSEQVPRDDNFGIGLWSTFPFITSRVAYIGTAEVPSLVVEIDTPHGKCTVLATHPLPPGGKEYSELRNGHIAELPQWVRQATSPVVLLGDLNVTPWNYYFKRLLRESGLKDSAQGRGVKPTWPSFNPLMLIPIDHCLHSHGIGIVARQTGPNVGSDHFPVIVDFVIQQDGTTETCKDINDVR